MSLLEEIHRCWPSLLPRRKAKKDENEEVLHRQNSQCFQFIVALLLRCVVLMLRLKWLQWNKFHNYFPEVISPEWNFSEGTRELPNRSRDQRVTCAGKDSEAPALSRSVSISVAALTALPTAFLHSHELGSAEFWDRGDNWPAGTRNLSPLKQ